MCLCLPHLTALDVSYSMWGVGPIVYGQFKLPGDVLVSGLAAVAPQLRTLRMLGVASHGTGFCPGPSASPAQGLALLQDLAMPVSLLLRSKIRDIGRLVHLRRLTLTDMLPGVRGGAGAAPKQTYNYGQHSQTRAGRGLQDLPA